MKKLLHIGMIVVLLMVQCFPIHTVAFDRVETAQNTHNIKKNPNSYWRVDHAPQFYGATKITLEIGSVDHFDVHDTRFRIFAKDFEDGDLTSKITYTGHVDVNQTGTYFITYHVVDSHNNKATIVVPVIVKEPESTIVQEQPKTISENSSKDVLKQESKVKVSSEHPSNSSNEEEITSEDTLLSDPSLESQQDVPNSDSSNDIEEDQVDDSKKEELKTNSSIQNRDQTSLPPSSQTEDNKSNDLQEVIDSQNSLSEVSEQPSSYKINVERTLYTIPSVWNMDMIGIGRCNYGDRQILGIYMPAGSKVRARILSASNAIHVNFLANDSAVESSATLNNDGNWMELSNTKGADSVPLFTSSVMAKGTDLDQTFKVELEYDSSVKELNYYHQNDNEENFRSKWQSDQNTYSIIENEVLTVVVPLADIHKLTNYYRNGFQSLDQFLEYWQKVVDKMDDLIGLELNPLDVIDQNVRTKYLVKANIHGAGSAYYSGNHVGVNSSSVAPFFEMNWGGLHEFAHGYQGTFGKGGSSEMWLGEVSNNILGHYIQTDKSIYFHSGDWLGNLKTIEENKNKERIDGKTFNETELATRLYVLINLFDSLEGKDTYKKIFKWYRREIQAGNSMKNQDAYALAISDIYGINIVPYMDAWKVPVSDSIQDTIYERNDLMINILNDTVSNDHLEKVLESDKINLKYGLVSNDDLKSYHLKGNLKIKLDIDHLNKLKGKKIQIKSGQQIIKTIPIDDYIHGNTIKISNIPVGTYYVQMPVIDGYTKEHIYVQIKDGQDAIYTYTYQKLENLKYENSYYMQVRGYTYDSSIGIQLQFQDDYRKVIISYPNQSAMNGNEFVKIYDQENHVIFEDSVAKSPTLKNFNYQLGTQTIDLQKGYVIEVGYPNRYSTRVKFFSSLTNKEVSNYAATSPITRYIIMENGIRKEDMSEEEANSLAYENMKQIFIRTIENYQRKATKEELNNRMIRFKEKQEVIQAYEYLNESDQKPYKEFIAQIRRGGIPKVKTIGKLKYEVGETIDLYSLIQAVDNEDGPIDINQKSTKIRTSLNSTKSGIYPIIYQVSDSDLNQTTYVLNITIQKSKNETINDSKLEGNFSIKQISKKVNEFLQSKKTNESKTRKNSLEDQKVSNYKQQSTSTKKLDKKRKASFSEEKQNLVKEFDAYIRRERFFISVGIVIIISLIMVVYFGIGRKR